MQADTRPHRSESHDPLLKNVKTQLPPVICRRPAVCPVQAGGSRLPAMSRDGRTPQPGPPDETGAPGTDGRRAVVCGCSPCAAACGIRLHLVVARLQTVLHRLVAALDFHKNMLKKIPAQVPARKTQQNNGCDPDGDRIRCFASPAGRYFDRLMVTSRTRQPGTIR